MTRIIAGAHGGRRLGTPPGVQTRPTSEKVREAFFSSLQAMTELDGARFADLYAGSGAVGLEALSRGAEHVLLVESEPRVARVVRENIALLNAAGAAQLITGKVATILAAGPEDEPYDVVFADPPYSVTDEEVTALQSALVSGGWLAPDAVVAIERSTRTAVRGVGLTWVEGITAERSRRYGETTLWYGRGS